MSFQMRNVGRRREESETHREILMVATRLIKTVGYRKATVADIAAELGMSPANVYRFFDSKKSINEWVADVLFNGIAQELESIASSDASPPDRVADFLRTLGRLSSERFFANDRVNDMVEDAMLESWSVCVSYGVRIRAALAAIIADGLASGHFRIEDASAGSACVMASMICFMHPLMMVSNAVLDRPDIEEIIVFTLRGLGWSNAT